MRAAATGRHEPERRHDHHEHLGGDRDHQPGGLRAEEMRTGLPGGRGHRRQAREKRTCPRNRGYVAGRDPSSHSPEPGPVTGLCLLPFHRDDTPVSHPREHLLAQFSRRRLTDVHVPGDLPCGRKMPGRHVGGVMLLGGLGSDPLRGTLGCSTGRRRAHPGAAFRMHSRRVPGCAVRCTPGCTPGRPAGAAPAAARKGTGRGHGPVSGCGTVASSRRARPRARLSVTERGWCISRASQAASITATAPRTAARWMRRSRRSLIRASRAASRCARDGAVPP